MKKILITGANSYIGTSFEGYMKQYDGEYQIDTVDMIDGSWREKSFSGYDCIFHVAGIAHRKETKENEELYYKVNRDLTVEVASKAKDDGVFHFIFLSSMSVYGMITGEISKETVPCPNTHYGKSKLQAEKKIEELASDSFKISILRPPMVYGKDCTGNFKSLVNITKKTCIFPKINNKRSMIYIDNLCSFVKLVVDKAMDGVLVPQNKEYANTSSIVKWIAKATNKKMYLSVLLGIAVKVLSLVFKKAKKAFGSLIYVDESGELDYNVCSLEESIVRSVGE